ncbi:VapC toxin family PIN domain ribonuclease [Pleurocapsa sp. CCALA 161]|uniref:type II toxin-antitoxin system VapC family toxin n=1 Tax=Pleurocapsa sp. CCALA 161 TaxID=2107688 RepID=UPI000D0540FC|nr:type II toxin-antitoxin system VapC family toxin [Pleurocapsa sp. CCALA 161]PSB05974.1 VapC toxin family PIN domain ribonuclease [Pleurocapsa sp. CCALA 161]
MIVADTNLIAYLMIEGDFTPQAELVYQLDSNWIAPYLWRSEFRNILALYLRKNYLSMAEAKTIMAQAEALMKNKEFELDSASILEMIENSTLSAYDCEYVVLAKKLGINLITNDKKILKSFPDLAVSLESYGQKS